MTLLRRPVELSLAEHCGPAAVLLYSVTMTPPALLGPDDPPPVEIINSEGKADTLLVCDHASAAIPASLGDLGLDQGQRRLHIAWDIGVAEVTRRLSLRLDAPGVLSGYSRLVIDCNRQLDDPSSIAQESDDIAVPGNRGLDKEARRLRAEACFWPYQRAVAGRIAAARWRGQVPILFSLHSFTPVMQGFERPWQVGILSNRDRRVAERLLASLRRDPALAVGDNQPYDGRVGRGYGIAEHGERNGLPHALIEIRQDQIDTRHGAEAMAARLAPVLAEIIGDAGLHEVAS
jgi:predicted N-formylglutamate amidohydrolase